MTRARDIANLVDANGDIVAGALDNVPASNDASALTTGTLDNARLPSSIEATNFHDGQGTSSSSNVNLGSSGQEGRGVVAGFSGSSYSSIGYNLRHTTTGDQYIAPGTDTTSFVEFTNGGIAAYGTGTGTAGRTLNKSGMTKLFHINSSGNWADVPSGTMINQEVQTATNYLTTSSGSWQTVWQPVYTPKMAGSTINIALSVSTLPEGSNSHDYWLGVYSDSARTVFTNQQQYWLDGSRAAGITGWHMVNIYLQTSISNTVSQGNNLYFLIQQRQNGSGTAYWNYSNAQSKMTITEVAP